MQSLRRLTGIVLNVLLVQASLAGYGTTCAHAGEAMGSETSEAIAVMDHAGVPVGAEGACAEAARDAGCPIPCAPEACAAITARAAPALPAGTTAAGASARRIESVWGDSGLTRQGPRPAPDLPPPRA